MPTDPAPNPSPGPTSPQALEAIVAQGLADCAGMIRFFSRLALPRLNSRDDPAAMPEFARAARMLPIAAVVIALPAALALWLLGQTQLPTLAVAALALAVLVVTTGALHEDGLADVADGFGGGATRERKLEIMKDSRIGAYGAVALGLALVIRIALIAALIDDHSAAKAALALIAAASVSRSASLGVMAALAPARLDGAARAAGSLPAATFGVAALIASVLALALGAPIVGLGHGLFGLAAAAIASFAMILTARAQIGGQTGDVIGASQQLAEIGFLIGLML